MGHANQNHRRCLDVGVSCDGVHNVSRQRVPTYISNPRVRILHTERAVDMRQLALGYQHLLELVGLRIDQLHQVVLVLFGHRERRYDRTQLWMTRGREVHTVLIDTKLLEKQQALYQRRRLVAQVGSAQPHAPCSLSEHLETFCSS